MAAIINRKALLLVLLAAMIAAAFLIWRRNYPEAPEAPVWRTFNDKSQNISFEYPEKLQAAYIFPVDWPPQPIVMNVPFSCHEAGKEDERAGETRVETINGREYCVTRITEGAAGSIYTQYAYAFRKGEGQMILTFSLRKAQCGNYDGQKKGECASEQESFDIGNIIDMIAATLQ